MADFVYSEMKNSDRIIIKKVLQGNACLVALSKRPKYFTKFNNKIYYSRTSLAVSKGLTLFEASNRCLLS